MGCSPLGLCPKSATGTCSELEHLIPQDRALSQSSVVDVHHMLSSEGFTSYY